MKNLPDGIRKLLEEQEQRQNGKISVLDGQNEKKSQNSQVKQPKYHNKPTERMLQDGTIIKFASKKEASRYDYLSILLQSGKIRKLKLQYQLLIKPSYIDGATGERFRAISYLADFVYEQLENGEWIQHIEDTKGTSKKAKGTRTAEFDMKRKLLADMGYIVEVI